MLPSAKMGFLNVKTDGKRKDRHNRELLFWLKLLLNAGCSNFLLHHVQEAGMNSSLPMQHRGKWYDLSYVSEDGEVFLVEIMRTGMVYAELDLAPGS